jgi:oligoribonuclease NrnB/cAMP/cGMP phosphodiesterase (DHH superfamily)
VIKEKIQEFKDEYVVYVDYCDQKDIMTTVHELVKGLLILDHHKTTPQKLTEELQECAVIDMNRSGAILAWDYCYPDRVGYAPNFLKYIGDRDIWKWEYPETEPFTTSFYTEVPFEFEEYQKYEDPLRVQAAIDKGNVVLSYENNQIQAAAQNAVLVNFLGYNVAVTNSTVHASKLGNTLAVLEGVDFAFIWFYDHKNNGIKVSLRSTKDKIDVSEIAQRFGGGGHQCASGFFWKNDSIQSLLVLNE